MGQLSDERRRHVVTHRSWARSHADSYERLEFLGDAVLQVVVTADLLRRHPEATEGDLAWMRQSVVSREACAVASRASGLPEALVRLAPREVGALAATLAAKPSVQAALIEALIGACATDLGFARTEPAVLATFAPAIEAAEPGRRDAKTALQEEVQRRGLELRYELVSAEGPAHARTFRTRVLVGGVERGTGQGTSKQMSEQGAAREAMSRLVGEVAPC